MVKAKRGSESLRGGALVFAGGVIPALGMEILALLEALLCLVLQYCLN